MYRLCIWTRARERLLIETGTGNDLLGIARVKGIKGCNRPTKNEEIDKKEIEDREC